MGMKDNKPKVTQNRLFEPGDRDKPKVTNIGIKQEKNNEPRIVDLNNLDEESANYISEVVKKHVSEQLREIFQKGYISEINNYNSMVFAQNLLNNNQQNKYDITKLEIQDTFGEYIKNNKINQTLLSIRTGISRGTLFNIIKSPNTVSLLNAKKIAIALGVDVEVLFPSKHIE